MVDRRHDNIPAGEAAPPGEMGAADCDSRERSGSVREWSVMNRVAVLFLVLGLVSAAWAEPRVRPVEWAQPVIGVDLGNFYHVSDEVYRSEQPDHKAMQQLRAFGIRSILNLREYHRDDDKAEGSGIRLYRVPMDAGKVDEREIVRALGVIATADKPLLVHCWHGSDRTGMVVALYRMVFQQWPRERAIDEFVNGGYGYHKSVFPNIEEYLKSVDIERLRGEVDSARSARLQSAAGAK